eukprot:TRINITY_DN63196_c0_g1_i1.p1 TRINITY_DN63196_c0_g1~~TRINITY_DN63196_c0_g1_i1.p1  ORF type:complete len:938 (-),score=115.19 TRINITY_DN63196_c0_g1_i1:63-2876(-)
MPICVSCGQTRLRSAFSANQLRKVDKCCKACTAKARAPTAFTRTLGINPTREEILHCFLRNPIALEVGEWRYDWHFVLEAAELELQHAYPHFICIYEKTVVRGAGKNLLDDRKFVLKIWELNAAYCSRLPAGSGGWRGPFNSAQVGALLPDPSLPFTSWKFADNSEVLFKFLEDHSTPYVAWRGDAQERIENEALECVLERPGEALQYANARFRIHRRVMLAAAAHDPSVLSYIADRNVVLKVLQKNGLALRHLNASFKADREIVMTALQNDSSALQYADASLKADRKIVLQSVAKDASVLQYCVDESLKADPEILLQALKNDASALQYVDRDSVLACLAVQGSAVQFVEAKLWSDREFVIGLLRISAHTQDQHLRAAQILQQAEPTLMADREILLTAAGIDMTLLRLGHSSLWYDPEFVCRLLDLCSALQDSVIKVRAILRQLEPCLWQDPDFTERLVRDCCVKAELVEPVLASIGGLLQEGRCKAVAKHASIFLECLRRHRSANEFRVRQFLKTIFVELDVLAAESIGSLSMVAVMDESSLVQADATTILVDLYERQAHLFNMMEDGTGSSFPTLVLACYLSDEKDHRTSRPSSSHSEPLWERLQATLQTIPRRTGEPWKLACIRLLVAHKTNSAEDNELFTKLCQLSRIYCSEAAESLPSNSEEQRQTDESTVTISVTAESDQSPDLLILHTSLGQFATLLTHAASTGLLESDKQSQSFADTTEAISNVALASEGGVGFVVAPSRVFKASDFPIEVTDADKQRYPKGYMTQRLHKVHVREPNFLEAVKDFAKESDPALQTLLERLRTMDDDVKKTAVIDEIMKWETNDRKYHDKYPEGHEAAGLPKDGYMLISTSGFRSRCSVGLPVEPTPITWAGVGMRHKSGLSVAWRLRNEDHTVVIISSASGKVHGLVSRPNGVFAIACSTLAEQKMQHA